MTSTQADLMLHPVRMRIILTFSQRSLTVQQLAQHLPDVPQATLYRHVKALAAGGLLVVAAAQQAHSNLEKVYSLQAAAAQIGAADLAQASKDDHRRYFTAFVAGLLGDFERYLQANKQVDVAADWVRYNKMAFYLSDDELRELQGKLQALLLPLVAHQPASNRRRRIFATILVPEPD